MVMVSSPTLFLLSAFLLAGPGTALYTEYSKYNDAGCEDLNSTSVYGGIIGKNAPPQDPGLSPPCLACMHVPILGRAESVPHFQTPLVTRTQEEYTSSILNSANSRLRAFFFFLSNEAINTKTCTVVPQDIYIYIYIITFLCWVYMRGFVEFIILRWCGVVWRVYLCICTYPFCINMLFREESNLFLNLKKEPICQISWDLREK